ncbi:DUF305 domain-containing protein [Nakamurella lactea]|uniref:DUF305 domain-containing protein n=1 Tax=Nakamurella lactea TaxID=459515 RepID=UPI0004164E01|nr:DUF305 domain-containing protein [Nakamurella lactea]
MTDRSDDLPGDPAPHPDAEFDVDSDADIDADPTTDADVDVDVYERAHAPGESVFQRWGRGSTAAVLSLAAVALLLVGVILGFAVRGSGDRSPNSLVLAVPANDSVDVGFARDMIVHHNQGITMAHEAESDTDDDEIRLLAYDINATQLAQVGQMQGWLALWQLPQQVVGSTPMTWMSSSSGHDMAGMAGMTTVGGTTSASPAVTTGTADDSGHQALMPGMATSGEMAKLKSLRGKESDIYFLQLMIRHHQGGGPMMVYAAQHATNPIVVNFAQQMWEAQTGEVSVMTQMLAERGAEPLPYTPPK